MVDLTPEQLLNLKNLLKIYSELKETAGRLNGSQSKWALAAGSAYYIYTGDEESLDDVDIWVVPDDKQRVAAALNANWISKSSERHTAENIEFGKFDIFTSCKRFKDGKRFIDYRWTPSVDLHLRKVAIDGVEYFIVSPEDVAVLKSANPRGEKEEHQAEKLLKNADTKYFELRKEECFFVEV